VRFARPRLVSRDSRRTWVRRALRSSGDASKLPAYAGAESNTARDLSRHACGRSADETRARSVQSELGRANGTQEFKSFLDGLRAAAKVEINKAALEKKQQ